MKPFIPSPRHLQQMVDLAMRKFDAQREAMHQEKRKPESNSSTDSRRVADRRNVAD